jgi:hypothetical protein
MRLKLVGDGKDIIAATVKNVSTTVTILAGSPVFGLLTTSAGSVVGRDCVSGSEATSAETPFFLGCAINSMGPGAEGYAQLSLYQENVRIVLNSRAASTDVFATQPAIALGDVLVPVTGLSGVFGWKRSSAVPTDGSTWARAANTYATQASSATTTSNSALSNEVATGKIWLRSL